MRQISAPSRLIALIAAGVLAAGLSACSGAAPAADPTPTETPTPTPTVEPEPSAADVEGRWCPTPESPESELCVTVAPPQTTYDDGRVEAFMDAELPAVGEDGGYGFSFAGAPFGTYFPADVPIPGGTPDYYAGADLPEADRIWNSQTGVMLVRADPPEITAESCADVTGAQAVAAWGADLPAAPSGVWDVRDLMGWADETYDACATLSWAVVPLTNCCLAGYPFEIMLFHEGEYIGPATDDIYGRTPEITRVDDASIEVTWSWVPDGGSGAGPFDTATSTFTWDDGEVVREGDLPAISF